MEVKGVFEGLRAIRLACNTNGVPNPAPSLEGLSGAANIVSTLGWLRAVVLIAAVAGLFIALAVWAVSSHSDNHRGAEGGKKGVVGSGIVAFLAGVGPIILGGLFALGSKC